MPKDLTLSEEVQSYIDTLDFEGKLDLSPEEAEARKLAEAIVLWVTHRAHPRR